MFEDILGSYDPEKAKARKSKPSAGSGGANYTGGMQPATRTVFNGKFNGFDSQDTEYIYINYVDPNNGKTFNIRYHWPDPPKGNRPSGLVHGTRLDVCTYDSNAPVAQRCRRLNVNTKKWDHIDVVDVKVV